MGSVDIDGQLRQTADGLGGDAGQHVAQIGEGPNLVALIEGPPWSVGEGIPAKRNAVESR
jgi:hypothetical protein